MTAISSASPPEGRAPAAAPGAAAPPRRSLLAAERYCRRVLPRVSRTFALSIRVLPGTLGSAVLSAYLICRIADTVEDAPNVTPEAKAVLLDDLHACLTDPVRALGYAERAAAVEGDPAHVDLVRHADLVFDVFHALPAPTRAHVVRWAGEMILGMRQFVLRYPDGIRIQTLEEYREYCYYVAGTVGYMLTDLWQEHTRSIKPARYEALRARCRAFAEALQTVNILKDVAQDAEHENSIYIPEHALRAHGSAHATILSPAHLASNQAALGELMRLAWHDLEEAFAYLLLLPRRALRIRLFCVLPLLFAFATMRDLTRSTAMLVRGGHVKITRREVKSLLVVGPLLTPSNQALRWLIERVRERPFLAGTSMARPSAVR